MKDLYTPYVRPDGIIVGIKGKAPEKPAAIMGNEAEFIEYAKALTAFIQSGHAFEDQENTRLLMNIIHSKGDPYFNYCKPNELLPPIELDVKEVEQYQSKFDGEWMDRLYQGENLPAPPDTVIRTALRIAKEEVKPTNPQAETDCKCGSDSPGWTEVKCCNLCGESVEAFWSKPTEEATETQEELWKEVRYQLDKISTLSNPKDRRDARKELADRFTIQRKPK